MTRKSLLPFCQLQKIKLLEKKEEKKKKTVCSLLLNGRKRDWMMKSSLQSVP